jgi:uncharacterized protein YbaP (TraB family)
VAGRSNTVYLFGSVHLLRPGEFALQGTLEDAYDGAAAVYLEIDMDDLSGPEIAAATVARAIDPGGRSLDELMGEDAALARARAETAGIDLSSLSRLEPWFAGLAVVSLALARDGYSAEAGVEQVVQDRAAADGKEILGLETLDEQLAALDSMEIGIQREFLLKALDDAQRPAGLPAGPGGKATTRRWPQSSQGSLPECRSCIVRCWWSAIASGWKGSPACSTNRATFWSWLAPCTSSGRTGCRACCRSEGSR